MTIGEQIKTFRKKLGLTQKQLADKCEVAEITIRQYELGKRQPRMEQLQKVASALNVQTNDLLPWEDVPEIRDAVYASELEMLDIFYTDKHFNYSKAEQQKIKQEISNCISIGNKIEDIQERTEYYDKLIAKYSHEFLNHLIEPYAEDNVIAIAALIADYLALNNTARNKVAEYAEELTEIPRYTKKEE
ncbi:MAG: helix-turn-helix domain-containing protein [Lachnospiraceae bacterium]|nr:helix-turn-helix domain-containing protein [Lachnospiraceae bacterium]